MKQTTMIFLSLVAAAGFSGCGTNGEIDQSKLCIFNDINGVKECKNGEMAMFSPASWGNEQLPITVAGMVCDFNHPVVYNNAGVICVYTDKRLAQFK